MKPSDRYRDVRGAGRILVLTLAMLAAGAPLGAQQAGPGLVRGPSLASRVLHVLGGAVVGGWVGWMGSQVAMSDWDRSRNGELLGRRAGWVAGGVVAGMIASQLIGSTSAPGAAPGLVPPRAPDRSVLTREEIALSGENNAYDLIQSLRWEWLRADRGTYQWSESARGKSVSRTQVEVTPGEARIVVYLNSTRLGGLEALRGIHIFDLQRVEFIGPQQAATRYGTGHAHGVIQLWTVQNGNTSL